MGLVGIFFYYQTYIAESVHSLIGVEMDSNDNIYDPTQINELLYSKSTSPLIIYGVYMESIYYIHF